MKVLTLVLLALVSIQAVSAAEELQALEGSLSVQTELLAKAKSRLNSAESSLKSNTAALTRAKLPDEQKTARNYVAIAQSRVDQERSTVVTTLREMETLKVRIVAVKQRETAPKLKLNPDAPATPKALHTLVMNDGRRIECVRFMEVDDQYALQMPDRNIQNIKKDEVAEIVSLTRSSDFIK